MPPHDFHGLEDAVSRANSPYGENGCVARGRADNSGEIKMNIQKGSLRTRAALPAAVIFGLLVGAALATRAASQDDDADGVLEFAAGHQISASEVNANFDVLLDKIAALEARHIGIDRSLEVREDPGPDQFANISEALTFLDDKTIGSTATVVIDVEGRYEHNEAIAFTHRDGDRIRIVGDHDDPESTILSFVGTTGLMVSDGNHLGYIGGLTLVGDRQNGEPGTDGAAGVFVSSGSSIRCGRLVVKEFGGTGVYAGTGSVIDCISGASIDGINLSAQSNGAGGVHANYGSTVLIPGCEATGNAGAGIYSDMASFINATDCVAARNGRDGFRAYGHASIVAGRASASENTESGFLADRRSTILAAEAQAVGNGANGYRAQIDSSILAELSGAENNGIDGYIAVDGSYVEAYGARSTGNRYGYVASILSSIKAAAAVAAQNTLTGFGLNNASHGFFSRSTAEGNAEYGYKAVEASIADAQFAEAIDNGSHGFFSQAGSVIYGTQTQSNTGYDPEPEPDDAIIIVVPRR